jgi:predicted nuclease with RNAse H fold
MGGVIAGVDYGSKTSGFTCVAFIKENKIHLHQAAKNKNADLWLKGLFERYEPRLIGIDAPLSLPGALRGLSGFSNYHYRLADIETRAMSPMFLGGLTARAIELRTWIQSRLSSVAIEVYPKLAAEGLNLDMKRYKKDKTYLFYALTALQEKVTWSMDGLEVSNWHQYDALLALYTAEKFNRKTCSSYGNEEEGLIYF